VVGAKFGVPYTSEPTGEREEKALSRMAAKRSPNIPRLENRGGENEGSRWLPYQRTWWSEKGEKGTVIREKYSNSQKKESKDEWRKRKDGVLRKKSVKMRGRRERGVRGCVNRRSEEKRREGEVKKTRFGGLDLVVQKKKKKERQKQWGGAISLLKKSSGKRAEKKSHEKR